MTTVSRTLSCLSVCMVVGFVAAQPAVCCDKFAGGMNGKPANRFAAMGKPAGMGGMNAKAMQFGPKNGRGMPAGMGNAKFNSAGNGFGKPGEGKFGKAAGMPMDKNPMGVKR